MHTTARTGTRNPVTLLLWLSLLTGWLVSIFSLVRELCLATACSDAASFTLFGVGLGWFGIAYFAAALLLLWQRSGRPMLNTILALTVYAGVGAELRLLWIQKFVIGSWCPLCVTICVSLMCAGMLLLPEKIRAEETSYPDSLWRWLALMAASAAVGLAVALSGVQALA